MKPVCLGKARQNPFFKTDVSLPDGDKLLLQSREEEETLCHAAHLYKCGEPESC